MRKITTYTALALCFFAFPLAALTNFERVALADLAHSQASLEVRDAAGVATVYAPKDLERLPTYRLATTTPWREEPAVFEGVLLRELLQAHGLADVPKIRVVAENDFVSVLERAVWEDGQVLIATRVNGRPHSRRVRGPFQFVVDADLYATSDVLSEGHLVWSVALIEATD